MPRLLCILLGNELRGLACAWWIGAHAGQLHPLTLLAMALGGAALLFAALDRHVTAPALADAERRRLLAAHRAAA